MNDGGVIFAYRLVRDLSCEDVDVSINCSRLRGCDGHGGYDGMTGVMGTSGVTGVMGMAGVTA
jgi:hypothetical protein